MSAITIPRNMKTKILLYTKKNLLKNGHDISSNELLDRFNQADLIEELIVSEMVGSKNKYLIDLLKELEDNKKI